MWSLLSWLTPGDLGNTSGSGTDPEDARLSASFLPQPSAELVSLPFALRIALTGGRPVPTCHPFPESLREAAASPPCCSWITTLQYAFTHQTVICSYK